MNIRRILYLCLVLAITFTAKAQLKMPSASPTYELKGTIGLADVKVVYSRPSAKGRTIFGDLVPFDAVWRTGANASTLISFSTDVTIEGNLVPAGEYALYTIPGEKESTIIIYKDVTLGGSVGYDAKDDLVRFKVPTKHPSSMYETFTISFSDFTSESAMLNMKWEHTKMAFTITNQVQDIVMAQIKAQIIDTDSSEDGIYYMAASFYYDNNQDSKLALKWSEKGIKATGDNPRYWEVHLKAKLLVRLGKNKEAISASQESMELAKTAGNTDYVKLNEKLIASLK